MNAIDILTYGHGDVLRAVDGLDDANWDVVGVTRRWSIRDLLAHLASYELLLGDAMMFVLKDGATPTLDAMARARDTFNADQVVARSGRSAPEILAEYEAAHARVMRAAERLGADRLREPGTIPWYGPSYALDDFIVYANYAHKREHVAQIRVFRRKLEA